MNQTNFANPNLRRLNGDVKPRTMRQLLLGVSLGAAVWAIAGLLLYLSYNTCSALIAEYYSKPAQARSIGEAFISLLMFFWWIFIAVVIPVGRRARKHLLNPRRKLSKDARDPILYLRSFADDYSEDVERHDRKTGEEMLASVLKDGGPVMTVGEPDKDQPILGAIRIYLKGEDWMADVRYLMSISRLVVVNANISLGLRGELKEARATLEPHRLLISFLSWQGLDEVSKQSLYERFKAHAETALRCAMPESLGDACFMYFESDWTCQVIDIGEQEKIIFGGVSFSFRRSSLFCLKVSTGSVRETLRPVLARRGFKLGVSESLLHGAKFLLLIIGFIIFLAYYPGPGWGILMGLSTLQLYSMIGNRATKNDTVSLNITRPEPTARKNKRG
jgi:hypothetical protein